MGRLGLSSVARLVARQGAGGTVETSARAKPAPTRSGDGTRTRPWWHRVTLPDGHLCGPQRRAVRRRAAPGMCRLQEALHLPR